MKPFVKVKIKKSLRGWTKTDMSTYTQILYQIIFGTKNHDKILIKKDREELFKFIWGILENKKCKLYRINGVEDHLHLLIELHPSIALSDLVKDIKVSSSKFIKGNKIFPDFKGWQDGYGAFTYSLDRKNILIEYIKNQEEHHRRKTFKEEYIAILEEQGVDFEEKYLL